MPIPDTVVKDESEQQIEQLCCRCQHYHIGTGNGPACNLTGEIFPEWREAILNPHDPNNSESCNLPPAGLRTCDKWEIKRIEF